MSAPFLEFAGGLSKYDYSQPEESKYSNSVETGAGYIFLNGIDDVSFKIKK